MVSSVTITLQLFVQLFLSTSIMLQPIRMLSACYALSESSHGLAALHRQYKWTSSTGAAGTHKHIQCMVYMDMLYRSSRDS